MAANTDLLAANKAFYDAFASGDPAIMDRVWARRAEVLCLHPGAAPLVGRRAVLASWREILAARVPIRHSRAVAFPWPGAGAVICREHVGTALLVATNLFVEEDGEWRMVHHHASPLAQASPMLMPADDDVN